jgi:prepilin-type N-terminal cleavage/methylation domain-containing protein
MKTSKLQQGFSLLELVVVIVIIIIVASIGMPTDYRSRARVTEGLALAALAKTAVAENAANGAPFNAGWIAPNATANTSTKAVPTQADRKTNVYSGIAINPANGIITITYTNKVAMDHILFRLPILKWGILYNSDSTFTIADRHKVAMMMSDTPTVLLLPIADNKTLPVAGKPTIVIDWECHSATAPTDDALTTILGTMNPKDVPANCRKPIVN